MKASDRSPTVYIEIFKSTSLVLSLFITLVLIFVTLFIFTRYETNVELLLQRSLVVAEKEYSHFFDRSYTQLLPLTQRSHQDIMSYVSREKEFDFWFLTDVNGAIIASNTEKPENLKHMLVLFESVWTKGETLTGTEIYPLHSVRSISNFLASRANISQYPNALFQITAMPLYHPSGSLNGSIIVGHLLNNSTSIAEAYSRAIPNSFLSISAEGVRVATNLTSQIHTNFAGSHQADTLTATVSRGDVYLGQVQVEPGDIHFVIALPIRNILGQIIGALTVGVPSNGLAKFKSESFIYILISLLLCLIFALSATSLVAKKVSQPITGLSRLAKQISDSEEIDEQHLAILKDQSPAKIQEVRNLQQSFERMTASLYQKCLENVKYLQALEAERTQLRNLTIQLQEVNSNLGKIVEEQTAHLHQAVLELKTLNNLKSKFLANMSHELRTPLNSIIGFTQMLQHEIFGNLNSKQREYTGIILNSARHLLEVINDILDLSLIEQNRTVLLKQEVGIAELIHSVMVVVKPQIEAKNLQLMSEIDSALPHLTVDPTRIKQILYNLLTNAIKFTPENGSITIKAECLDSNLAVSVSDTGIGIKPEDCRRVFDEFYQVENIYQRKFAGVGLGLPLSKRLVELHGGQIKLVSELNKGTTVIIYLPIYQNGGTVNA